LKSKLLLVCLSLIWLSGCYYLKQGRGQLDLRFSQIAIESALEQEPNPTYRHLFEEIPRIKSFAQNRLLLRKSDNYTGYYKTSQPGVTFVVTASPKDKLTPYTWWFPIVGSVPYKGYFNQKEAEELAENLESRHFDTWVFAAPAYSTLGWFKDPVTTPMLKRGGYYLASTIIHEMVHETVFVSGEDAFNEQLASFVGQEGAMQYFAETKPMSQEQVAALREKVKRSTRFAETVQRYLPRFRDLYDRQQQPEVILAQRKILFSELEMEIGQLYPQLPVNRRRFNNARLLQYERYAPDSPVIQKMWMDSNGDWSRFWKVVDAYVDEITEKKGKEPVAMTQAVENISYTE